MLAAEDAVVFAKACELGLEGIVSKRKGSFYMLFGYEFSLVALIGTILLSASSRRTAS